jgi:lysophospholipid acyltransferase (LPLAT)-like uncharacterized protein
MELSRLQAKSIMRDAFTDSFHQVLKLPPQRPGQPDGLWPYVVPPLCEYWLAPLIRRIGATWEIKWFGLDYLRTTACSNSWILASWHEALLMNMFSLRDSGLVAVVSPSWEGEIIARTMRGLGIDLARGSSGHQPMHAIRESVRQLQVGETIGWVVDGPIGPRRVVKPGILQIASMAQRPILPMHAVAKRKWTFPTWDQQAIPYPGTNLAIGFGEPFHVPKKLRGTALTEYSEILNRELQTLEFQLTDAMMAE